MIGNVLQGVIRGMQAKRDEKNMSEDRAFKKQMMNLQMQDLKYKQSQQQMKNKFLEMLMPKLQGQETATQSQPSVDIAPSPQEQAAKAGGADQSKPQGLADMLASMDPIVKSALSEFTGIDLLGAGRLSEQQRANDMRASEYVTETGTDASGAPTRSYRPKYGPPPSLSISGQGQPQPNMTGPPPVETFTYTKDGSEYEVIREKQTGRPVTTPVRKSAPKAPATETAGKLVTTMSGIDNIKKLRSMIINPDGSVNRSILTKMSAPMGGIGEGRQANSMFNQGIDAPIRAMTGAAINKEEVPYYERIYKPSILDSDELIKNKMDRFEKWANSYVTTMDPDGSIRKRIKDQSGAASQGADIASQYKALRDQGLSPEEAGARLGINQ